MNDMTETQKPKMTPEERAMVKKMAASLWASSLPKGTERKVEDFRAVSKEFMQKSKRLMRHMKARGLDVVVAKADATDSEV